MTTKRFEKHKNKESNKNGEFKEKKRQINVTLTFTTLIFRGGFLKARTLIKMQI